MNKPQVFNHAAFGDVRSVEVDGKPHFIGVDIARALDYSNPSKAVTDHCKGVSKLGIPSPGGVQETNVIPEGDVYRLIIKAADQSRNPEIKAKAEQFERWIFDEVLPTVRRTGGYVADDDLFIQTYLPHTDPSTQALFRVTLATVRKQNEQIAVMQPKADYFDALVDANLLTNFRDTAKELHVSERFFTDWLIGRGYIYRNNQRKLLPYARHTPELFQIKEFTRGRFSGTQTFITPRGRETFRLLLEQNAA